MSEPSVPLVWSREARKSAESPRRHLDGSRANSPDWTRGFRRSCNFEGMPDAHCLFMGTVFKSTWLLQIITIKLTKCCKNKINCIFVYKTKELCLEYKYEFVFTVASTACVLRRVVHAVSRPDRVDDVTNRWNQGTVSCVHFNSLGCCGRYVHRL
jgi:hypothetical protein